MSNLLTPREVILYCIHQNSLDIGFPAHRENLERVSRVTMISLSRLNSYISNLRTSALVVMRSGYYGNRKVKSLFVSEKGKKVVKDINIKIERKWVHIPDWSAEGPGTVPLTRLLGSLNGPFERTFLLTLVSKGLNENLRDFIMSSQFFKKEGPLLEMFFKDGPDRKNSIPFMTSVLNTTLFGDVNYVDKKQMNLMDNEVKLLLGELYRKNAKIHSAKMIFSNIIKDKEPSRNEWLLANIGLVRCARSEGQMKEAFEHLDGLFLEDNNAMQNAYLNLIKGELLAHRKEYDSAERCFIKDLGTYRRSGYPHFTALTELYLGLVYFHKMNYELAESYWRMSIRTSNSGRCHCLKAYSYGNLVDIFILKKDLVKAENYLKKSERIMLENNDLEGLAGVDFNRALLYIAKEDIKKAYESFVVSEHRALPFPWKEEKEVRRQLFLMRLREKGFDYDEKVFIDPPLELQNSRKYL